MDYVTYEDIKEQVRESLGIEDETFIDDTEMMAHCNAAIAIAESEIHSIYEDYFLTYEDIPIVAGTALYDLPTTIYANKVRGLVYDDGSKIYPIKRFKYQGQGRDIFTQIAYIDANASTLDEYQYLLVNSTAAAGVKLRLVPAAQETAADHVHVWFIREANKIVADDSLCDIPEFSTFIVQYIKMKCYEHEGHANYEASILETERLKKQMIETLTNMVPDDDTEIPPDFTFYEEIV